MTDLTVEELLDDLLADVDTLVNEEANAAIDGLKLKMQASINKVGQDLKKKVDIWKQNQD
ncbi:MAG: hypothetical protein D3910_27020 [Candidatus Electrothrix sp. ATG2]|nr:hypothetical protein [Candidatus Electrothrix sp. ATG2]